jgi:tetratricopeptide (TPR) repeat protein
LPQGIPERKLAAPKELGVHETPQPSPVENFAQSDRLDSWKEIAVYLKRDVRTVQRWEKTENLPVRRHLHEKQGTVYAFKSEIDAWSRDRQPQDDEEPADDRASNVATDTDAVRTDPKREATKPEPGPVHRLFTPVVKRSLVILAVAAAGALAAHLLWPQQSLVLAVLPFKNLGASDREAIVDGFTAETKIRLEQVQPERMGVLLLTKRYADLPVDKVAAEFNAAYVLQGDARIVGQKVSITARLLRSGARGSTPLWSDQYEGDLQDIQRIQSDVSAAIARAVLHEFPGAQPTQQLNTEAYEAYQWGNFFLNKRTTRDLLKALDYFQKAAQVDTHYAPAYAGLAATYSLLGSAPYTLLPPKESYSKAEAAARRALALDETLAEAHLSLGYSLLVYERNYEDARREFERAIQLRPGYATAHDYYAYYLTAMGEMNKAIAERETARRLDPVSPLLTTALGEAYFQNRQFDLAIQMDQKSLELDPSYPVTMINLARGYDQAGMHPQARDIYQKLLGFAPDDPGVLALAAHEYAVSGDAPAARKIEAQLESMRSQRYVAALYIALVWTGLGDRDRAFQWLDQAYDEDCEYLVYFSTEPMADPLRSDPRFPQFLQKLGLTPRR